LSKNPYDQTLTFVGKGSINASSNGNTNTNNEALVIKLSDTKLNSGGSDNSESAGTTNSLTTLNFTNTAAIVALQGGSEIKDTSVLNSTGTSLIGDFKGNTTAVFGDTANGTGKFFGHLSNTATSTLDLTLNANSLYDVTTDKTLLDKYYNGDLKNTSTNVISPATITFANTTATGNKLT
ncbi:hypothetical protein, partial [Helicobacter sp. 12S02634-8]|uniref:hypothetical protein n=1 Tax=Helicobacter sp. 12S02634-8 TaxID=1476199 RepID=UPI00155313CC